VSARYYKIVATGDVASEQAHDGCVTTHPRYSVDGTKAILKFNELSEGSITHAQALTLMSTDEWTDSTEVPP